MLWTRGLRARTLAKDVYKRQMYRSLHEHKYQTLSAVSTFADGIQVKTPGELTYKLCEEYVDDIVTVTEDETAAAILSLMENQKLVAEGAGAVPVRCV